MIIKGSLNFMVAVDSSKIHGKGLYAEEKIESKRKIGELAGDVISKREARLKAKLKNTISIVELWNGKALDASVNSNALRYINHSCQPNTYMRTIGNHVEFYALRSIEPKEELTCNYGTTHHEGRRKCNCGADKCKGFI
jgi:uncharacterized protein